VRSGETFTGHFGTGSGSDTVKLEVGAGDQLVVRLRSRWMGRPPFDAVLACTRVAGDDVFGWIRPDRLALIEGDVEKDVPIPDLPSPPIVEYIRRPESTLTIPEDGTLATMRSLGYATWDDVWHLLLWLHPYVEDPIDEEGDDYWNDRLWLRALRLLDKRRLALIAPPDHASR
jgi:hypothetical protein